MITKKSLAVGFFSLTALLSAETTFKDAIKESITNHPSIQAAKLGSSSAEFKTDSIKALYRPSLDARAAIGMEQSENTAVIAQADQHKDLRRFESSLTLSQRLYTGGQLTGQLDQAKAFSKQQVFNIKTQQEIIALRAAEAYLDVLKSSKLLALSEANITAHQEILDTTNKRNKEGLANKADVIQVEGRLSLAQAQFEREVARLKSAKAAYIEAFGTEAGQLLPEQNLAALIPYSLERAKSDAVASHPELLALKNVISRSQGAVTEAKSGNRPQIQLEVSANENDGLSGVEGNNDSYRAMVVMNWNLFRGAADKANIASLGAEKSNAQQGYSERRLSILRDLTVAWHSRQALLVELNYFKQHEQTIKKTYEAYTEQHKLGERTLFDLLNAQEELFQSESRVIDTYYETQLSTYDIFSRMGNFTNKLFSIK